MYLLFEGLKLFFIHFTVLLECLSCFYFCCDPPLLAESSSNRNVLSSESRKKSTLLCWRALEWLDSIAKPGLALLLLAFEAYRSFMIYDDLSELWIIC